MVTGQLTMKRIMTQITSPISMAMMKRVMRMKSTMRKKKRMRMRMMKRKKMKTSLSLSIPHHLSSRKSMRSHFSLRSASICFK